MRFLSRVVDARGNRRPSWPAALACLALALGLPAAPAQANIIPVNSTADTAVLDGSCTLREAIVAANTNTPTADCLGGGAADVIEFDDTLACPSTITLGSLLPAITTPIDIDGYTHSGSSVNTLADGTNAALCIVINAGGIARAFDIQAGVSRVRGLVFQNYSSEAVLISGGAGSTIDGNFIGTNVAGTAGSGLPQGFGVHVLASGNTVGGTAPANRNLISANGYGIFFNGADNGFIQGNLIGTNDAGTAAIPSGAPGVAGIQLGGGATNNLVGGAVAGAGNVIAGYTSDGIQLLGPNVADNTVQGNLIGLTADGTAPLGNVRHGIVLFDFVGEGGSTGNVIDDNVIAANPRKGIAIDGSVFTDTVVTNNLIGTLADGTTAAPNGTGAEPANSANLDPAIDILHAATAQVADNRIYFQSGGAGVLVRDVEFTVGDTDVGPGALLAGSTGNCIVGNAAGAVNTTGVLNTFESNWWGTFDGPSGVGPGSGDSVSANLDFDPFLTAAPAGCLTIEPDLTVVKTAAPNPVTVGGNVVFTITVSNAGPGPASAVTVNDVLPAGFVFVSSTGCAESPAGGVPTCTLGDIAAGADAAYTITATATAPGSIQNSAVASTTAPETDTADNTGSVTVQVSLTAIPTLGEIGLGLLVLLLAAGGVMLARRTG